MATPNPAQLPRHERPGKAEKVGCAAAAQELKPMQLLRNLYK